MDYLMVLVRRLRTCFTKPLRNP